MRDSVEQLLAENDMAGDEILREFLTELQHTGTSVSPMPSAELSELMTPISSRSIVRRRGTMITALVIIGTVGVGVTAAAADPEMRTATNQALQTIIGTIVPGLRVAPNSHPTHLPNTPPAPTSSESGAVNATTTQPVPNHADSTSHPGPSNHPGARPSTPTQSNSGGRSSSGSSHPSMVPSAHPARPRG